MIFQLFRKDAREGTMARLYGMIVAQARLPTFYESYDVPDTVNGRFEMVLLHVILLLDRLEREPSLRPLGQGLFDLFCSDMDATLREMGVGDLSVPRKMRRIGEAFYGRQAVYLAALAASDNSALVTALANNISPVHAGAERLADYVRETVRELAAQEADALRRGEVRFPAPVARMEEIGASS